MIGHGEDSPLVEVRQNQVAAALTVVRPSQFLQSLDQFPPRDDGYAAHTQTTWASKSSSGTGQPRAWATSIQPSIASLMLAIASALVLPWLMQPRSDGHSTTQYPSSPLC